MHKQAIAFIALAMFSMNAAEAARLKSVPQSSELDEQAVSGKFFTGLMYRLPKTLVQADVTYAVYKITKYQDANRDDVVGEPAYLVDLAKPVALTFPTTGDAKAQFRLPTKNMESFTVASDVKLKFDANGVLYSVNSNFDDKTGEIIKGLTQTAVNVGALTAKAVAGKEFIEVVKLGEFTQNLGPFDLEESALQKKDPIKDGLKGPIHATPSAEAAAPTASQQPAPTPGGRIQPEPAGAPVNNGTSTAQGEKPKEEENQQADNRTEHGKAVFKVELPEEKPMAYLEEKHQVRINLYTRATDLCAKGMIGMTGVEPDKLKTFVRIIPIVAIDVPFAPNHSLTSDQILTQYNELIKKENPLAKLPGLDLLFQKKAFSGVVVRHPRKLKVQVFITRESIPDFVQIYQCYQPFSQFGDTSFLSVKSGLFLKRNYALTVAENGSVSSFDLVTTSRGETIANTLKDATSSAGLDSIFSTFSGGGSKK